MGEDLENKTREELIRHIKMLNHNMNIMQKELDNSVSKDDIRKAISALDKIEKHDIIKYEAHYAKICMQELLGDD